jgi:hypothetical protein
MTTTTTTATTAPAATTGWNYRAYGTAADPIHKSDLAGITGDFGCDRAFRYKKDAIAEGADAEPVVSGKAAAGNATHETIARALKGAETRRLILEGVQIKPASVLRLFQEEMDREIAGREVRWYRDDPAEVVAERVLMITALLENLHRHVAEIVLVESGFIVPLDGYWLSGHVDLLYRPKSAPSTLALADWKTGSTKPTAIELDHGWESGIYSRAVQAGHFDDGEGLVGSTARERRAELDRRLMEYAGRCDTAGDVVPTFGEFPSQVWHVHLQDYVPYSRAGSKEIKRPEDSAPRTSHRARRAASRLPATSSRRHRAHGPLS